MKKRHLEKKPLASKNTIEVSTAVRLRDFFPEGTPGATFREQLEAFLPVTIEDIRKRYVYREDDPNKVARDVHTTAWLWKTVWGRCVWFFRERDRRGTYYDRDRNGFDAIDDLSDTADVQMKEAAEFMKELQKDAHALEWKLDMPRVEDTDAIQPGWKRNKLVLKQVPNGKIPAIFSFGDNTYTVPSGKAWDIVCSMIRADAFDAHGLEMNVTPGHHFKRTHRPFFSQRMNHKGKDWWIMTR